MALSRELTLTPYRIFCTVKNLKSDLRADLPDSHWQKLRRRVFNAQENCCADCGQEGFLTLHHLTYQSRQYGSPGRSSSLYTWETEDDVTGLCWSCHHQRHLDLNGDFWADPEEMESHWYYYYKELSDG